MMILNAASASKFAVTKLLDEIHHVGKYHEWVVLRLHNLWSRETS